MIRLALPAGDLREETARVLEEAGLPVGEYAAGSRTYHFALEGREEVRIRVFREKDIPIQIALGNYDLGVCGLVWAQELLCRYPYEAVVLLSDLGMGRASLFLAAAAEEPPWRTTNAGSLRIVTEYPNLAETLAMGLRLSTYRVLPVWGAAEAYPPEDAELALLTAPNEATLRVWGLRPLHRLLETSAWLVANHNSLAEKDLTPVLGPLLAERSGQASPELSIPQRLAAELPEPPSSERDVVRFALPDGHQQPHAVAALAAAGLRFPGYEEGRAVRRLSSTGEGLEAKVIRPQDMPQQVALGSFDLAISGRDWLLDHLRCFPSSPVEEVADLGRGRFSIVATVDEELPAETLDEALTCWQGQGQRVVRVASEYVNLADHYAREHHMGHYQVIPVSGASEGFVPEDADILIEGTETGGSLAANRLKTIDRLFESTTCVIAARRSVERRRQKLIDRSIASLRKVAMSAPAAAREN